MERVAHQGQVAQSLFRSGHRRRPGHDVVAVDAVVETGLADVGEVVPRIRLAGLADVAVLLAVLVVVIGPDLVIRDQDTVHVDGEVHSLLAFSLAWRIIQSSAVALWYGTRRCAISRMTSEVSAQNASRSFSFSGTSRSRVIIGPASSLSDSVMLGNGTILSRGSQLSGISVNIECR